MKKYPKVLKLKNNQEITLRLLTKDDMELLVQFFQSLPVGIPPLDRLQSELKPFVGQAILIGCVFLVQ